MVNELSGSIPASLGNLTNLQFLYLSANRLSGTIPAALGNLANLTTLVIDNDTGLCLAQSLPLDSPFAQMARAQGVSVCNPGSFTDPEIMPGVTPVRAIHFTELRSRTDARRAAAGLAPYGWTDAVLTARATPIRLVHLLELRAALEAAYAAAGQPAPPWTDATPAALKAVHLTELRDAVVSSYNDAR